MKVNDTLKRASSSTFMGKVMTKMVGPLQVIFGFTLSCTGFLQIGNSPLPGYGIALIGSILVLEGITRLR